MVVVRVRRDLRFVFVFTGDGDGPAPRGLHEHLRLEVMVGGSTSPTVQPNELGERRCGVVTAVRDGADHHVLD